MRISFTFDSQYLLIKKPAKGFVDETGQKSLFQYVSHKTTRSVCIAVDLTFVLQINGNVKDIASGELRFCH